jgi:1,4-dihydroxy-2-naphthoate octaprenyltransferase
LKIKAWIHAFRLRTLPLALSIILAGTAVSVFKTESPVVCDDCPNQVYQNMLWPKPVLSIFLLTFITTLFLQILSNLANDYGDFSKGTDNKDRIGPARALQGGGITKKQMRNAILIFAGLSLFSGVMLLYRTFGDENLQLLLIFLGIGVFCIIGAITYTIGKAAYGYRALGDLGVFIFFGGVGILGTAYLQVQTISVNGVLIAAAYGMWAVAVLNLNNMRDVDNDIAYGKKTMAYLLGFKGAKIYQDFLVFTPYILSLIVFSQYIYDTRSVLAFLLLPLSVFMQVKVNRVKKRGEFDKFLKIQALLTLANSIVLFSCIYLLHD